MNNDGNDIKVGSNNDIWYISNTITTDGYAVYKYDEGTGTSTLIAGTGGVRVGVAPDGNAWIVTTSGSIRRWIGASWITMPGKAHDIIIGSDSIPVIVTTTPADGGYTIAKWDDKSGQWSTISGIAGVSLAIDGSNNLYVTTDTSSSYHVKGKMSKFCRVCKVDCASCSDAATCESCRTTLCLANNQCLTCPSGTYPSQSISICAACPDTCDACTSSSYCQQCKSGYILINNQCCVDSTSCGLDLSPKQVKTIQTVAAAVAYTNSATKLAVMIETFFPISNPTVITSAGLVKLLAYIRYINISHSPSLELLFLNYQPSLAVIDASSLKMTDNVKSRFDNPAATDIFRHYGIVSSFLVNFWDGLVSLLILMGCLFFLHLCDLAAKKWQNRYWLRHVTKWLRVSGQNYLISVYFDYYGDFVLYALLEFYEPSFKSPSTVLSFIVAIIFLLLGSTFLLFHVKLLQNIQRLRSSTPSEQLEAQMKIFEKKHEGIKILFTDFKSTSFVHQAFILFFTLRAIVYSFTLRIISHYPLAQTIVLLICSFAILYYIIFKQPFQSKLDLVQQVAFEILIFVGNISLLSLAVLSHIGQDSHAISTKYNLSMVLIILNVIAAGLPWLFLIPRWSILAYETRKWYKEYLIKLRSNSSNQRVPPIIDVAALRQSAHAKLDEKQAVDNSSSEIQLVKFETSLIHDNSVSLSLDKSSISQDREHVAKSKEGISIEASIKHDKKENYKGEQNSTIIIENENKTYYLEKSHNSNRINSIRKPKVKMDVNKPG